jgi:Flp pilus assembly pilin Flp
LHPRRFPVAARPDYLNALMEARQTTPGAITMYPRGKALKALGRLLREEDGPTSVEYAIMLALVLLASLTAVGGVRDWINTILNLFITEFDAAA